VVLLKCPLIPALAARAIFRRESLGDLTEKNLADDTLIALGVGAGFDAGAHRGAGLMPLRERGRTAAQDTRIGLKKM
jgi:hypothetical protein